MPGRVNVTVTSAVLPASTATRVAWTLQHEVAVRRCERHGLRGNPVDGRGRASPHTLPW